MARVEIPITVQLTNGDAVVGASVTVRKRSDSSLATIFQAETGGTSVPNPAATDANGRVTGWVDRGAYVASITGGTPPVTAYAENFDASPGGDGTIDLGWIPDAVLPIGAMMLYAADGDPSTSWLICNGRPLSRTQYAALFARIGTAYGTGDGSTTFNLPDLQGRVPVGAGPGAGLTDRARGVKGGEEAHTMTSAETAPHTHAIDVPGFSGAAGGGGDGRIAVYPTGGNANGVDWLTAKAKAGAATPHNTMQPFVVTNFIIRAA